MDQPIQHDRLLLPHAGLHLPPRKSRILRRRDRPALQRSPLPPHRLCLRRRPDRRRRRQCPGTKSARRRPARTGASSARSHPAAASNSAHPTAERWPAARSGTTHARRRARIGASSGKTGTLAPGRSSRPVSSVRTPRSWHCSSMAVATGRSSDLRLPTKRRFPCSSAQCVARAVHRAFPSPLRISAGVRAASRLTRPPEPGSRTPRRYDVRTIRPPAASPQKRHPCSFAWMSVNLRPRALEQSI
jgi:hypothetical protein